jgi:hypothetical protein
MKSPEFKNNLRINFIQSSGSILASSRIVSKITEVTSCDLKKQSGNDPHSKRSVGNQQELKKKNSSDSTFEHYVSNVTNIDR